MRGSCDSANVTPEEVTRDMGVAAATFAEYDASGHPRQVSFIVKHPEPPF